MLFKQPGAHVRQSIKRVGAKGSNKKEEQKQSEVDADDMAAFNRI